MKKNILLISTLCITVFSFSQISWNSVTTPLEGDLVSVCFTDLQHGFILSEDGMLAQTSDAGLSWEISSLGNGTFTDLCFTDGLHGCVVGYQDSSFIMLTEDGGNSWSQSDHLKAQYLNDVFFIDDMKGWVVGLKDNMNYNLYTADGGQSWSPQMDIFVMEGELYGISFRNDTVGSTCGKDGMFLVTNSGGANGWALDVSMPQLGVDLYALHNWGEQTGCAVGENGTALYTINNWAQHIETNTTTDLNLYDVASAGTSFVWAVGDAGMIQYTSNYLLGWVTQPTGVTEDLRSICMIDALNGWAVGSNAKVLHYSLGSAVQEINNASFTAYTDVSGNRVVIELLRANAEVELSLIDISGKTMRFLNSCDQKTVVLDVSDLSPGLYVIRLQSNHQEYTQKILWP